MKIGVEVWTVAGPKLGQSRTSASGKLFFFLTYIRYRMGRCVMEHFVAFIGVYGIGHLFCVYSLVHDFVLIF